MATFLNRVTFGSLKKVNETGLRVNQALLCGTKNTVRAKACLDKHYSELALEAPNIEKLFATLKRDQKIT